MEGVKNTLWEIKKNPQETKSEGQEAGIHINNLEHKEEINIGLEQNEETRIQKTKNQKQKQGEFKKTLGHLQKGQHPNQRDARRRRGRTRNLKLTSKSNKRKLP